MRTLKGQNFRVLVYNSTTSSWDVVAMSTSCQITRTGNTEEASTKDVLGMASAPTIVSKSWGVTVETLNVLDAGAMLNAVKSFTPFSLMWDEVSEDNNSTTEDTQMSRQGQAYISDLTLTFNDRENSGKNIQFTGSGPLTAGPTMAGGNTPTQTYTKGQFVRLFVSSDNTTTPASVIGAAKQLSLHVSVSLEDATTKDTSGDWQVQEPTGLSYDITTNALVRSSDTITSAVTAKGFADLESIHEASTPVKWQIANVSGANNRTKGTVIASGAAIITKLDLTSPNREKVDYTATLTGYGDYAVGA